VHARYLLVIVMVNFIFLFFWMTRDRLSSYFDFVINKNKLVWSVVEVL